MNDKKRAKKMIKALDELEKEIREYDRSLLERDKVFDGVESSYFVGVGFVLNEMRNGVFVFFGHNLDTDNPEDTKRAKKLMDGRFSSFFEDDLSDPVHPRAIAHRDGMRYALGKLRKVIT